MEQGQPKNLVVTDRATLRQLLREEIERVLSPRAPKKYVKVVELARELKIDPSTIHLKVRRGELKKVRIAGMPFVERPEPVPAGPDSE